MSRPQLQINNVAMHCYIVLPRGHDLQCRLTQKFVNKLFLGFLSIKNNPKMGENTFIFFLIYLCDLNNMHEEEKLKSGRFI